MPETSKQSTDWRTMDATLAIAIEALQTARILVRNSAAGSAGGCARYRAAPVYRNAISFSTDLRLDAQGRYDPARQEISMAARKLVDVCEALKSVSAAIETNALAPKQKLIIDRTPKAGPAGPRAATGWARLKEKVIANVSALPSANDNLLLIRGSVNFLIKKLKQFVRPGAECFPGQDRIDEFVRFGAAKGVRFIKRLCAIPFLRYSPTCALKFLRVWKRFWSELIAAPEMPRATLADMRNARPPAIRPSAAVALFALATSGLGLLMPGATAGDGKMADRPDVRFVAADPIITGAFARTPAPVWVSRCSTRAWGKACYARRNVRR